MDKQTRNKQRLFVGIENTPPNIGPMHFLSIDWTHWQPQRTVLGSVVTVIAVSFSLVIIVIPKVQLGICRVKHLARLGSKTRIRDKHRIIGLLHRPLLTPQRQSLRPGPRPLPSCR